MARVDESGSSVSQDCDFFVTCRWNTLANCFLLAGSLFPTSMRISEEGRLVVNFKTEARFHGLFVMSHPGKWNLPFSSTTEIDTHPRFRTILGFFLFLLLIADFFLYYALQIQILPLLVISYLSLISVFRLLNLLKYTLIWWQANSSTWSRAWFMKDEDLSHCAIKDL